MRLERFCTIISLSPIPGKKMTRLLILAPFPDLASAGEFGYSIYGSFSFFPYFVRYYSDLNILGQFLY